MESEEGWVTETEPEPSRDQISQYGLRKRVNPLRSCCESARDELLRGGDDVTKWNLTLLLISILLYAAHDFACNV